MRLLLTTELGRLARWLRLMGCDAELSPASPVDALTCRAVNEQRVLVTRIRAIGTSCVFRVVHVTSPLLDAQLTELLAQLPELRAQQRFSRCDRCNVPVEPIAKAQVEERAPPYVYQTQERFTTCPRCQRIYWPATHWQRAQAVLDRIAA